MFCLLSHWGSWNAFFWRAKKDSGTPTAPAGGETKPAAATKSSKPDEASKKPSKAKAAKTPSSTKSNASDKSTPAKTGAAKKPAKAEDGKTPSKKNVGKKKTATGKKPIKANAPKKVVKVNADGKKPSKRKLDAKSAEGGVGDGAEANKKLKVGPKKRFYKKGLPVVPESVLKRRKRRDYAKKAAIHKALKVK